MNVDTRWLRIKTFRTIPLVISIGSHNGPRLNITIHRACPSSPTSETTE